LNKICFVEPRYSLSVYICDVQESVLLASILESTSSNLVVKPDSCSTSRSLVLNVKNRLHLGRFLFLIAKIGMHKRGISYTVKKLLF